MNFPDGSYTIYMIQYRGENIGDCWGFIDWHIWRDYIRESLHYKLFECYRFIRSEGFFNRDDAILAMNDLVKFSDYKFRIIKIVLDKKSEVIL